MGTSDNPKVYSDPWPDFTEDLHADYLESLADYGTYIIAADEVGCSVVHIASLRKSDPEFDKRCQEALKRYRASFMIKAADRARHGTKKKIMYLGEEVATETVHHDMLMSLFLKRNDPAFRDSSKVELSGGIDVRKQLDVSGLSREGRQKLRELLEIIKADAEVEEPYKSILNPSYIKRTPDCGA